jgi:hypothetical protein
MERTMKVLNLVNGWKIEQKGDDNFNLIHTVETYKENAKAADRELTSFYGTLFQALDGFIQKATPEELTMYDIGEQIEAILDKLKSSREEIKEMFRTEVRVVR